MSPASATASSAARCCARSTRRVRRAPAIPIRYVVVPAMARRKFPDPVFLLAGGPGQSAIAVAASTMPLFSRLNNRRDIVFVDQRGTGARRRSCARTPSTSRSPSSPIPTASTASRVECKAQLLKLPYIRSRERPRPVHDLDRGPGPRRGAARARRRAHRPGRRLVRDAGRARVPAPVPEARYGAACSTASRRPTWRCRRASRSTTRPRSMRSSPPAPPSRRARATIPTCSARFAALLQSLPRAVKAAHPLSGRAEEFVLTRDMLLGAVRSALYVPALAAALPEAIDTASRGEFAGLIGLNATFASRKSTRLATGMHLSVVCAEDVPRLRVSGDRPGADFGLEFARFYERLCSAWPRGEVPAAFYGLVASAGAGAGAERRHRSGDAAAARRARRSRARPDGAPRRRRQRRARRARRRLRSRCRLPLHRCERRPRRARGRRRLRRRRAASARLPAGRGRRRPVSRSWRDDRSPRPRQVVRRAGAASGDGGWRAWARSLRQAGRAGSGDGARRERPRVHAVRDVSFDAPNGRITGLLGPNGAGKTTTLRMLAALITPEAGTMRVDGIDVVARPREVLARMGVLSDSRGLYPRLTARENIVYYGALHGMEREAADARAQDLARMFDMTALLDRRAAGFSQGERMKTALVRALVHDPANIVLDEPTNGLDVLATRALRDSLRWLRTPEGGAEVHRLLDPHHAGGRAPLRQRRRRRARPHGRHRHRAELLAETDESDFEEAFVKLAFVPERAAAGARREAIARRLLGRPAQGAERRLARPPHARHRAGVVGADGAARPARDLRARRLARIARRATRGLRRRARQRADAAQLPRAPDLRRQGSAGRLRGAAAPLDVQRSGRRRAGRFRGGARARRRRRSSRSSPTAPTSARRRARRGSSACSAASVASARCSAWRCAASRRSCSSRCRSRTATSPARRRGRRGSPACCPTS